MKKAKKLLKEILQNQNKQTFNLEYSLKKAEVPVIPVYMKLNLLVVTENLKRYSLKMISLIYSTFWNKLQESNYQVFWELDF